MPENDENSYIYIQDDYTLESDLIKTKANKDRNNLLYSFDRSTPQLSYSNTLSSFNKNNYIDTSHSTPRRLGSVFEDRIIPPNLNRDQSSIVYLNVSDSKFSREGDFVNTRHLNTGRSSTCNVRIPCEFEKYSKPELQKRNHWNHNKYSTKSSTSHCLDTIDRSVHEQNQSKVKNQIDLESQNEMEHPSDTDSILSKIGRDMLLAPEFASDDRTRKCLSLFRELYVGIIGCQLVYVLTTLLFGNAALAIIVTLLLIQSCFCHADGRPMAYFVNALLSLAIGITVIVALAQDVSGLEPFRTEPVLKTLSYVYIPICFIFTMLSVFLGFGFRRLHTNERKAIVNAANNLLGKEYFVDQKSLLISKHSLL